MIPSTADSGRRYLVFFRLVEGDAKSKIFGEKIQEENGMNCLR